jgi:VWFA-related protein
VSTNGHNAARSAFPGDRYRRFWYDGGFNPDTFWPERIVRQLTVCLAAICLLAGLNTSYAQDSDEPVESGVEERVEVTLVQVDALVMDNKGRTVPDLKKEDFTLRLGNQDLAVATFDVACPIGSTDDPVNIDKGGKKTAIEPIGPDVKRKIAFVFDYYFLPIPSRQWILDAAEAMLILAGTGEEEIAIIAMAYGVRVEQRFTTDRRQLVHALRRMEHDKTLWPLEFAVGASGKEYFTDMTTLMDVLEGYPGPKAVILFSELRDLGKGSRYDLWFGDVATHAAFARTAIYPSYAAGLQAGSGARSSDALARFANESGGRMPLIGGDVSLAYRWAQRDLSCRYTLGAYIDSEEGRAKKKEVRVNLDKSGHQLRYPELLKLFTDEERLRSRSRAAFVDPGPYENPLVRASVFPARPTSANSWDSLVVVNFPMPHYEEGGDFDIRATIKRGNTRVDKYENRFHVEPAADGNRRPVTIFGDTRLKSGQYDLTIVLSKPDGDQVVSARTEFTVAEPLEDLLILRGPLLAKVVPGGKLIRADAGEQDKPTKLDEVLGEGNSFEPLVVHQIASSEELLSYWNACIFGKSQLTSDAVIQRKFVDSEGNAVHELDSIPLQLKSVNKKLVCHDDLQRLASGTLPPGEYDYEVTITDANGDLLAKGGAPLAVD